MVFQYADVNWAWSSTHHHARSLINNYAFSEDVHFENSYYFTNVYSDHKDITNFRAYDEMNLNELVGQSDILILEVNNAAISDMSWGFIDYLLEHTEYLDDVY